ncbi:MAG TPA: leucyl aminopeptidase [Elusimicrobiota bacterium]|nr:leucyl aminopeptidase [Elusimicrobiota bacterium]
MISPSIVPASAAEKFARAEAFFVGEDGAFVIAPGLSSDEKRRLWEESRENGFKASVGECAEIAGGASGARRKNVLVGLGKKKDATSEALRRAGAALYRHAKGRWENLLIAAPLKDFQALAEGFILASYEFTEYKKPEAPRLAAVGFKAADAREKALLQKSLDRVLAACRAVAFARDLVNRGASDKTPEKMGDVARTLAGPRVKVEVFGREKAAELGMGSFLSVARGSEDEPAFVRLVYKPSGSAKKRIGLVGKGITFDSGGLSLKPPASMETMKMDMAGAAAVLAVFQALPILNLKVEVHGFCPFTYNLPGPRATKPGDVVKAMNGKTIEILNTDAEGRLVLADALCLADQEKLDAVIDMATLTGAAVTALGGKVAALMGGDKALVERLLRASRESGEMMWELPLVKEYREMLKSDVADLRNIGRSRGEAGTIIGGLFLQEFAGQTPWAHLDIAGPAWSGSESSYFSQGGTGTPVRAILRYLESL